MNYNQFVLDIFGPEADYLARRLWPLMRLDVA